MSGVPSAACLPATTEAPTAMLLAPLLAASGTPLCGTAAAACVGAVSTLSLTREAALGLGPEEEVVALTVVIGTVAAPQTMTVRQWPYCTHLAPSCLA